MFNQVTIVGRFTRDPEVTYTKDGTAVCNFTLAVQRSFRNTQGEYDADFVPVTVWRKQAENTALYCHKGALVGVNGRIHTRAYENKEQKRVHVVEVNADQVRFLKLNSHQPAFNAASQQTAAEESRETDNTPLTPVEHIPVMNVKETNKPQ
ncbi:single-strand DNA-binding protein [Alteribacillus persepolensis]|uniref:Single-stranded DNA-binding protein n=1 Tax=Alteribacillus persepolensis TaxID=568899 RepID=A0A1G8ABN8_9BACI|nr:single-stranded DNA-binding protein [Alteribacillus persepolensis]SDH18362.1 single-strand DNA-binding protein [Alteribacillus persepolensis]